MGVVLCIFAMYICMYVYTMHVCVLSESAGGGILCEKVCECVRVYMCVSVCGGSMENSE